MTKPSPKPQDDEIQAPARITADHVQSRVLSPVAGAAKGWKRQSPLEAAYDRGQLAGGNRNYTPEARYTAGLEYGGLWSTAQPGSKDSLDMEKVNSSARPGSEMDKRLDAIQKLISIESHLSANDRKILRMVCGEWIPASEAIRSVTGDFRDEIWARMREALDGLVEGMETARRGGFKRFNSK